MLIYNVDVGHIHGEDDNSRQVWVPKKCVQIIKSQNFKTDAVPLTVLFLLAFIVIVITAMLNIHFHWIIILQGFPNVIFKTCSILGNHFL